MLVEKKVLETRLEDLDLYDNILKSRITNVSTRLNIFPCAEFIRWILSKEDEIWMIMYNMEGEGFASFTPAFIAKAYSLPPSEVSMTTDWVKGLTLDYMATTKMMVAEGKNFWHKQSGEYETAHLRTQYRMAVLMLNRIFDRADGRSYKFGWIPLIYHIAMVGAVFNWADIVANS